MAITGLSENLTVAVLVLVTGLILLDWTGITLIVTVDVYVTSGNTAAVVVLFPICCVCHADCRHR